MKGGMLILFLVCWIRLGTSTLSCNDPSVETLRKLSYGDLLEPLSIVYTDESYNNLRKVESRDLVPKAISQHMAVFSEQKSLNVVQVVAGGSTVGERTTSRTIEVEKALISLVHEILPPYPVHGSGYRGRSTRTLPKGMMRMEFHLEETAEEENGEECAIRTKLVIQTETSASGPQRYVRRGSGLVFIHDLDNPVLPTPAGTCTEEVKRAKWKYGTLMDPTTEVDAEVDNTSGKFHLSFRHDFSSDGTTLTLAFNGFSDVLPTRCFHEYVDGLTGPLNLPYTGPTPKYGYELPPADVLKNLQNDKCAEGREGDHGVYTCEALPMMYRPPDLHGSGGLRKASLEGTFVREQTRRSSIDPCSGSAIYVRAFATGEAAEKDLYGPGISGDKRGKIYRFSLKGQWHLQHAPLDCVYYHDGRAHDFSGSWRIEPEDKERVKNVGTFTFKDLHPPGKDGDTQITFTAATENFDTSKKRPAAGGCFPKDAVVSLAQGEKRMDQLQEGDEVLTLAEDGNLEYQPIVTFSHRVTEGDLNGLIHIDYEKLSGERGFIQASPSHILGIKKKNQPFRFDTPAVRVALGDELMIANEKTFSTEFASVTAVTALDGKNAGIFAPHTLSGTIVVNNAVASCYVDLAVSFPDSNSKFLSTFTHEAQHQALSPFLRLHTIFPSILTSMNVASSNTVLGRIGHHLQEAVAHKINAILRTFNIETKGTLMATNIYQLIFLSGSNA